MVEADYAKFWSPAFDNMDDMVFIIDNNSELVKVNSSFLSFTGKQQQDLIGKEVCQVLYGEHQPGKDYPCHSIFGSKVALQKELYDPTLQKWLNVCVTPLFSGEGSIGRVVLATDISGQKNTEDLLKQSQALYRAIVDDQTELICRFSADKTLTFVNDAYCRYFGKKHEELIGKSFLSLVPEDEQKTVEENFKTLSCQNAVMTHEHKVIAPHGEVRWQQWINRAIFDEGCKLYEYQAVGHDITDRKNAEKILFASELKYRTLVEHISAITYVTMPNNFTNFIYISPQFGKILGFPPESYENNPEIWNKQLHPEDRKRVLEEITRSSAENRPFVCEYRMLASNGHIAWFHDEGVVVQDNAGHSLFLQGVMYDITERKQKEEELKNINDLNQTLLNTIPFGIDIVSESGDIMFLNSVFESVVGKDAVGKKCWQVYKDDKFQCPPCPLIEGINIGQTKSIDVDCVLGGRTFQIFHTGMFYNDKKAVMEIFIDTTERKKIEQNLQRAVQVKSDFTSMVSHELRTPLTAIKEGIAIVFDETAGVLNEEQKEFLDIAKRNVDRLARLINDVLDFQKLDSGKMTFDMQENDINDIAEDVRNTMLPLTDERDLDIILNLEKNLPKAVFDKDKINQVLSNLVHNAIKCTGRGNITVTTSLGENFIKVSVSDTGKGIKPEDISKLFQQFEQLDSGCDRSIPGTGLGLAISKEIIEAHKGRIWAESELDKGSTFNFILPITERRN